LILPLILGVIVVMLMFAGAAVAIAAEGRPDDEGGG
jgi:hypothetical protein